jgi:hypothetical protein
MSGKSAKWLVQVWAALALVAVMVLLNISFGSTAFAGPVPASIAVSLTSPTNPSLYYEDVIYTATVVTSDGGNLDINDDGVEFTDNGGDINGCSYQPLSASPTSPTVPAGTYTATCDESGTQMNTGDHSISADFYDPSYGPGSASLTQTVNQGPTTTTIAIPQSEASVPYGNEGQNSINFTVSPAPGINQSPSGTVNLYSGYSGPGTGTYLCTAYLGGGNGESTGYCYINSNQLTAGVYSLTAVYSGDGNFLGSTSAPQTLTVTQVTSQLSVFPVPGYAFYGAESGNFFIVGEGGGGNGSPTGDFSITANGISLIAPNSCSAGNGGGNPCFIASPTALPASSTPYTVTVSYPGDPNFTPASTTVPLLVLAATTTTSLALSSSRATYGREGGVAISATVTSGTTGAPTGPVIVQSGGNAVCTVTNLQPSGPNTATGSCSPLSSAQLAVGDYTLTANYQGDGNYQSSVSSALSLVIASQGYWLAGANGQVFPFGTAGAFGSTSGPLNAPIVGIASTPNGGGYWEVAQDGGVFSFGNAQFYGSMGGSHLNQPIVGIDSTPDGKGYWEVARDGGVFTFGDAHFYGSMGGTHLNQPMVGIAADPATGGYWLVAADGGIFAFYAPFLGSTGGIHLNAPVVGMAPTPNGGGYWEVASDGGLFTQGDAPFFGSMGGQRLDKPIVAIHAASDGAGYRMVASDGGLFTFGDAEFDGSMGGQSLSAPIVGISS